MDAQKGSKSLFALSLSDTMLDLDDVLLVFSLFASCVSVLLMGERYSDALSKGINTANVLIIQHCSCQISD